MSERFDPRPHLRELRDGAPYLDVKWRLHWLRSEHPEAVIETQLISLDGDTAVCKATVRIPDGGSATGHASAARGGDADHIEHAETRAIGRALAALGYGAQFTEEDVVQARETGLPAERPVALVTQPSAPQPSPQQPTRMRPVREVESDDDEPDPRPPESDSTSREPRDVRDSRGQRESRPIREVREAVEEDGEATEPTPLKRGSDLRGRTEPRGADAPAREDVSWTRFWDWAKRRGYRDAAHLRDLLGIDVNALTPGEVRDRIRRYELDHPAPNAEE
jgi:hypothetical protein